MNAAIARVPVPGFIDQHRDLFADVDFGVQRTPTADLPGADYQAVVLARALIEVLSGRRSVAQLVAHCTPQVSIALAGRIPPAPLPHLLTVRVCEPADGVLEIAVVFRRDGCVDAVAFRLEGLDRRWQITVVELVENSFDRPAR